eukprot:337833-Rhodomonas_salina.1
MIAARGFNVQVQVPPAHCAGGRGPVPWPGPGTGTGTGTGRRRGADAGPTRTRTQAQAQRRRSLRLTWITVTPAVTVSSRHAWCWPGRAAGGGSWARHWQPVSQWRRPLLAHSLAGPGPGWAFKLGLRVRVRPGPGHELEGRPLCHCAVAAHLHHDQHGPGTAACPAACQWLTGSRAPSPGLSH